MAVQTIAECGWDRCEISVGFLLEEDDGWIGRISNNWRQGRMRAVSFPIVDFTHGWHGGTITSCAT